MSVENTFKKQIFDILRENGQNDRYIYHFLQGAKGLREKWQNSNLPLNNFIKNQIQRLDYCSSQELFRTELVDMTYDAGFSAAITKQILKVKNKLFVFYNRLL